MSDPFSVLGVPPRFDLDLQVLHQRFLAAAAEAHPDRFADPLDQADAVHRSAAINQAYRALREPESRGRALLRLRSGTLSESDEEALPPALLMEVMETREAMEEAVATNDAAALHRLRADAEADREARHAQLNRLFGADPLDAAAVRRELNVLRYIQRMLEQMPEPA